MLHARGLEQADPFQSTLMISGTSLQDGQQTKRRKRLHSQLEGCRESLLQEGSRFVVPTGADGEPSVLFVQAELQAAVTDLPRDLVGGAQRPLSLAIVAEGDLGEREVARGGGLQEAVTGVSSDLQRLLEVLVGSGPVALALLHVAE